ncbi:MAG: hypothetical protein ACM3YO_01055 [Bacteroidota bacterium]
MKPSFYSLSSLCSLCCLLCAAPARADEKLPIELPNVVVMGKASTPQTWGTGGSKLPLRPEVRDRITLPAPAEQRASQAFIPATAIEATPSVSLPPIPTLVPVSRHAQGWLGLGTGLEVGGYYGIQENGLATIQGQAALSSGWSALALEAQLDRGIPASARYDYRGWEQGKANRFSLGATTEQLPFRASLESGLGWLPGDRVWELGGTGEWHPFLSVEHQPTVSLDVGRQTTLTRGDWTVRLSGQDRWQWDPQWSLTGGATLGTLKGQAHLDPKLVLDWRPLPSSSLALTLAQETTFPAFDTLYLSRLWIEGTPDLLSEHQTSAEVSGGHLIDKDVYLQGTAKYAKGERLIALQTTGTTWRYRNLPDSQDVWEGNVTLQFLQPEHTNKLSYHLETLDPLGAASQRIGLARDGKIQSFSYEFGSDLAWEQLGSFQTGGNPEAGWQWLLRGQVVYPLDPNWQVYLSAQDFSLLEKQPLAHFFTPLSLLAIGVKGVF